MLLDATYSPDYVHAMSDLLARRRTLPGTNGRLVGLSTPALRDFDDCISEDCPITTLSAEQSNSSVLLGDTAIFKFIRRFEEGINPEVEIGRFLTEQAHYPYSPRVGGNIEYHSNAYISTPATVAILEEFIPHEEDGWRYVVDALAHGLEDAVAHHNDPELDVTPPHTLLRLDVEELGPGHPLVGAHLEWATLLGQRTAELHAELTSDPRDPAFAPEPLTALDRQSLYHGARSLTRQVFHEVRALDLTSPNVVKVLAREDEVLRAPAAPHHIEQ